MQYVSTRDPEQIETDFTSSLLDGLGREGGLNVPAEYPQLSEGELTNLQGSSYVETFLAVNCLFVGDDIPRDVQEKIAQEAYDPAIFPVERTGDTTPVWELFKNKIWVQDLWRGPTISFKDIAMQAIARQEGYLLERHNLYRVKAGGTSGDTGSAAEEAYKDQRRIEMFMLSPLDGMSKFQRAQMGDLTGGRIHNISYRGDFDACQAVFKAIQNDKEFSNIGAVNSVNWGRIAAQVAYHVYGYLQVAKNVGDPVDISVPSGNFGDALSAYIAREMGVPIRHIIVATNENDILHTAIQSGVYEKKGERAIITSSPSMDITKASNFERLVFDLVGRDPVLLSRYMEIFETTGRVAFSDIGLPNNILLKKGFKSESTHENERRMTIVHAANEPHGRIIDPHTADGVHAALGQQSDGVPVLCMSTASAVKFEDTIQSVLQRVPTRPERFIGLEERVANNPESFVVLGSLDAVKAYIQKHSSYLAA